MIPVLTNCAACHKGSFKICNYVVKAFNFANLTYYYLAELTSHIWIQENVEVMDETEQRGIIQPCICNLLFMTVYVTETRG